MTGIERFVADLAAKFEAGAWKTLTDGEYVPRTPETEQRVRASVAKVAEAYAETLRRSVSEAMRLAIVEGLRNGTLNDDTTDVVTLDAFAKTSGLDDAFGLIPAALETYIDEMCALERAYNPAWRAPASGFFD